MNDQFEHTSFIKTACQKWNLDGLTNRDKDPVVMPFTSVFSSQKRTDWPEIPSLGSLENFVEPDTSNDPLNGLQKAILVSLLEIEKSQGLGKTQKEEIQTIGDMMEYIKRFK